MSRTLLNPSTIAFYAEADPEDLVDTSARQRFEIIRKLMTQMFNQAAQEARSSNATPSLSSFPEEYAALTTLARSFSHSQEFSRFIIRATDRTLDTIQQNEKIISSLRLWPKLPIDNKTATLRKIVRQFMLASDTLSGINFTIPIVKFYTEAKDADGDATMGHYTDITEDAKNNRGIIALNKHKHACFNQACLVAATALHEAVHAVQDQIGIIGQRTPSKIKPYHHDSRLAAMLAKHKAFISYKLDTPYRAQFHERLAYSADERFFSKLKAIL